MAERDSEDMQSTDVHEDVDDMQNMSKSTPVSIKDRAEKLRQATLEEIEEKDKILEGAVQMFMENNVKDAEDIINENAPLDPFHALGAASIAAFKAMLLMEDNDMKHALEKASFATSFASKVAVAPKSAFSSMLNMFRSEPEQKLQPGMFRAKTIYALALSVHGTVLILQDSWSALIQGGMALRKCYGILQSQRKVLDQLKKRLGANSYDGLGVDRNSVYGLLLMLGATHIVLSLLPPHLQTILSFFGINFDRDRGLDLISVTRKSETIFSPFAALFLMVITCAVPSFCSYHVPKWLPLAKAVAEDAIKPLRMDEFMLYRCIVNRISGLEHDVSKSISTLSRCLEAAEQGQIAQWLPQLCVFALYDQGWNLVITSQWREAAVIYRRLEQTSRWLKMLFGFAQACCYDMLALEAAGSGDGEAETKHRRESAEALWRAAHYKSRVIGGKKIPAEEFVEARLKEVFHHFGVRYPKEKTFDTFESAPLPAEGGASLRNLVSIGILELIAAFNLMHRVPQEDLEKHLATVEETLKNSSEASGDSSPKSKKKKMAVGYTAVVPRAIKANMLCRIGTRREEAKALLESTLEVSHKYKGSHCSLSWIVPHMLYEKAILAATEGDKEAMKSLLKKAREHIAGTVLLNAMDVRLHLTDYGMEVPPLH